MTRYTPSMIERERATDRFDATRERVTLIDTTGVEWFAWLDKGSTPTRSTTIYRKSLFERGES